MIKKVVLATLLAFSLVLTACGTDEENDLKQENNTVVDEKGYAGWFDAEIPEGYVETKSSNEATWEFTNQSDQSIKIIIEVVKLYDGSNRNAKDESYENALMEKLEDKEYIRF